MNLSQLVKSSLGSIYQEPLAADLTEAADVYILEIGEDGFNLEDGGSGDSYPEEPLPVRAIFIVVTLREINTSSGAGSFSMEQGDLRGIFQASIALPSLKVGDKVTYRGIPYRVVEVEPKAIGATDLLMVCILRT